MLFCVTLKIYKVKDTKKKESQQLRFFILLRGLDSNERPPGYEPGELPTAPPRDVISKAFFSNAVQRYDFFFIRQIFRGKNLPAKLNIAEKHNFVKSSLHF